MILSKALWSTSHTLSVAGIEDAPIEADVLLCHVLGTSRTQLYTEAARSLTSEELDKLQGIIQRRLLHEPIAYILGRCEFYGIEFHIDHRALIPRPETELLVEKAIEAIRHHPSLENFTIADIGTGSGVIAISLALALPQAKVYATDISALALQVAEINCRRHRADNVDLLQGNLLEPLPKKVDMIVANLPYIRNSELRTLSPEITDFEPTIALAGGEDGIDNIASLLAQIPEKTHSESYLFLEIGQGQDEAVTSLINSYLPQACIKLLPDLSDINRVAKVHLWN